MSGDKGEAKIPDFAESSDEADFEEPGWFRDYPENEAEDRDAEDDGDETINAEADGVELGTKEQFDEEIRKHGVIDA